MTDQPADECPDDCPCNVMEISRLLAVIDALELRNDGFQSLLAAYRSGGYPREKAWNQIKRAKKKLADLGYERLTHD